MCELFGMSSFYPTDINRSLKAITPRGGQIGPHADGWGLAFFEDRAARIFKEPAPAADSRCLAFVSECNCHSRIAIGHIRKANPPEFGRSSANTHPFERELGGRSWVFAHNGKLQTLAEEAGRHPIRFRPKGDTDSENAFCLLLNALSAVGLDDRCDHASTVLLETLTSEVDRIATHGEFNFLLSNGEFLAAFANSELHLLRRSCIENGCRQKLVLLATSPLSDEPWVRLKSGRLHVFERGEEIWS